MLKAIFINCTLKNSSRQSHTEGLMQVSMDIMRSEQVKVDYLRLADYNVPNGLLPDMTKEGVPQDDWPSFIKRLWLPIFW